MEKLLHNFKQQTIGRKIQDIFLTQKAIKPKKPLKNSSICNQKQNYMGNQINQQIKKKSARSLSAGIARTELCNNCNSYIIETRFQKHKQVCENRFKEDKSKCTDNKSKQIYKVQKQNKNPDMKNRKLQKGRQSMEQKKCNQQRKSQKKNKIQQKISDQLIMAVRQQQLNSKKWRTNPRMNRNNYSLYDSKKTKDIQLCRQSDLYLQIHDVYYETQNGFHKVKKNTLTDKDILGFTEDIQNWIQQKSGTLKKYGPNLVVFQLQIGNKVGKQNQKCINAILQVPKKQATQYKYKTSNTCGICLNQFLNKQLIKNLKCLHSFHAECINIWLHKSRTCPICRQKQ